VPGGVRRNVDPVHQVDVGEVVPSKIRISRKSSGTVLEDVLSVVVVREPA
jgi:hypothetical protein